MEERCVRLDVLLPQHKAYVNEETEQKPGKKKYFLATFN